MATILIVEDEDVIRNLLATILKSAGHAVITAANGLEGVALFRSNPERFDLILTDLKMPVMNGYELVALARETHPSIKIICMSGYAEDPFPANTEFLPKPFAPDAVLAHVKALLGGD